MKLQKSTKLCASLLFASMLCACSDIVDGQHDSVGDGKVLRVFAKPSAQTRVSVNSGSWFDEQDSVWHSYCEEYWDSGDQIALVTPEQTYYYSCTMGGPSGEFEADGTPVSSSASSVIGVYPASACNGYCIDIPALDDVSLYTGGNDPRVADGYIDYDNNSVWLSFRHILSKVTLNAYSDSTTTAVIDPYFYCSKAVSYNVETNQFNQGWADDKLNLQQQTTSYHVTQDNLLRPSRTYGTMITPGAKQMHYTIYGMLECSKDLPDLVAGIDYDIYLKVPRSPELSFDFEYGTADLNIYFPENFTFPEGEQYSIDIIYKRGYSEKNRWTYDINAGDIYDGRLFYYVPLNYECTSDNDYSFEVYRVDGSGEKDLVYSSGRLGVVDDQARNVCGQWSLTETGKNSDGSDFSLSYGAEIFQNASGGARLNSIRQLPITRDEVWLDGYMLTMMQVSHEWEADGDKYAYIWKGRTNSPIYPTRATGTVTCYKKSGSKWTKEFVHDFVMTKD